MEALSRKEGWDLPCKGCSLATPVHSCRDWGGREQKSHQAAFEVGNGSGSAKPIKTSHAPFGHGD